MVTENWRVVTSFREKRAKSTCRSCSPTQLLCNPLAHLISPSSWPRSAAGSWPACSCLSSPWNQPSASTDADTWMWRVVYTPLFYIIQGAWTSVASGTHGSPGTNPHGYHGLILYFCYHQQNQRHTNQVCLSSNLCAGCTSQWNYVI